MMLASGASLGMFVNGKDEATEPYDSYPTARATAQNVLF